MTCISCVEQVIFGVSLFAAIILTGVLTTIFTVIVMIIVYKYHPKFRRPPSVETAIATPLDLAVGTMVSAVGRHEYEDVDPNEADVSMQNTEYAVAGAKGETRDTPTLEMQENKSYDQVIAVRRNQAYETCN